MINIYDKLCDKPIKLVERPLSNSNVEHVKLKQASGVTKYSLNPNNFNNFISKYAEKPIPCSKENSTIRKGQSQIIYAFNEHIDAKKYLNKKQDENTIIDGWSAADVANYRNEILDKIDPKTLETLTILREKKNGKTDNLKMGKISKESELLSKIQSLCKEKKEMEVENNKEKTEDDLSFLPIKPNNSFVNMDKLEMNKLEWMKFIDISTKQSRYMSIRFHIDGTSLSPFMEEEELRERPNSDPFINSLNHHGEEPERDGYTIPELFWLSRSSFPMQRSIAIETLINIVKKSKNLEHVYRFNFPTVTENLVESGLIFLARWLIDEAGEREQHLFQALNLLHTIIVSDDVEESDEIIFNYPNSKTALYVPRMMSKEASKKHTKRLELPPSERGELKDDIIMAEDIITCLVNRTFFLDRMSFLFAMKKITVSNNCIKTLIEILQRFSVHSLEMANILCHEYEELLQIVAINHILEKSMCSSYAVRLVRLLCQNSRSIAHKLTRDQKIINAIYCYLTDFNCDNFKLKIECLRLITVFVQNQIHIGPIQAIMPTIFDELNQLIDSNSLNGVLQSIVVFLGVLVSSETVLDSVTYSKLAGCVDALQIKFLSHFTCSTKNITLTLASLLNLILIFRKDQYYNRSYISCHQVATDFWDTLISPIISSTAFNLLMEQLKSSCILGYEHHNPNLEIFTIDLENLLQDPLKLPVKTRNPKFIDTESFFIFYNHCYSLMTALCNCFSFMASTRLSLSSLCGDSESMSCSSNFVFKIIKFLNYVANSPLEKIATSSSSPYSSIYQLQIETVSLLIICVSDLLEVSHIVIDVESYRVIYKAAIKILPYFGPNLVQTTNCLMTKIIFNTSFINAMKIPLPGCVNQLLVNSLPEISRLYEHCYPVFGHAESNSNRLSIDQFLIPSNWIDSPFYVYYNIQGPNKAEADSTLKNFTTNSVINCLSFIMLLESGNIITDKISAIDGIRRLSCLLMSNHWIESFLDSTTQVMLSSFLNQYLKRPDQIDISSKHTVIGSFFSLYTMVLDQYFCLSYCDSLVGNLVMFPCSMRFPVKFRKTLWKMYFDNIRLICLKLSDSILSIDEFLQPEEVDNEMIRHYWQVLKLNILSKTENELLYWICIHHLNRFIFNQSLSTCADENGNYILSIQRGMVHAVCNPSWQRKSWVKDIRLYKHFVNLSAEFYDELPLSRYQHLNMLEKIASEKLKNVIK